MITWTNYVQKRSMVVRSLEIETYMVFKHQIVDIPVWRGWHVVIRVSIYIDQYPRDISVGIYFKFIKNKFASLSVGRDCQSIVSNTGQATRILFQESSRLSK